MKLLMRHSKVIFLYISMATISFVLSGCGRGASQVVDLETASYSSVISDAAECREMVATLEDMDEVGLRLHSSYQRAFKNLKENPKNSEANSQLISSLVELYDNDKLMFRTAFKYPQCFSGKSMNTIEFGYENAAISSYNVETWKNEFGGFEEDWYPEYSKLLPNLNDWSSPKEFRSDGKLDEAVNVSKENNDSYSGLDSGSDSQETASLPTCVKLANTTDGGLALAPNGGNHWGRSDGTPGYCILPNSGGEKFYYSGE